MILDLGIKPYYSTTRGDLYNADCLDILPKIPDKAVDLCLTDPPYGINYNQADRNRPNELQYNDIANDKGDFDYKRLFEIKATKKIIFGAENFYKHLPHRGRWICWDKRLSKDADKMLGSSFELAWVDTDSGYYKTYRVLHGGVVNADKDIDRIHPTQKPTTLFKLILQDYSKENDLILDPFSGSGTTAVACEDLNRRWICIEKEEKYCELSAKRIDNFLAQGKLF